MDICNQYFVKETYKDKHFQKTIKCSCCEEETSLSIGHKLDESTINNFFKLFYDLHTIKGCNEKVKHIPFWANK